MPFCEPAKNWTVAVPPDSGFLTIWIGLPSPSRPKLPRLVLRATSVSEAGVPSCFLAVTVSVAAWVEPVSIWLRSAATDTVTEPPVVPPLLGVSDGGGGATGFVELQAVSKTAASARAVRRRHIFIRVQQRG